MTSPTPAPGNLERPDPRLLTYYTLSALMTLPAFPFVFLYFYFRYHTLRYRFDAEGISMRWGILFRREVLLNYARIQDIQIRANIVERWLGLARIELQTAAGNSGAEMTLEGFRQFEAIRDFLYERMRGVQGSKPVPGATLVSDVGLTTQSEAGGDLQELALALKQVASELRQLRASLPPHGGRHD